MAADKSKDPKKKVKRPTAQKRDLQNEKRRLQNKAFRSRVRTAVRNYEESIKKGDESSSKEALSLVYSLMDKGAKKGIFKSNTCNRTKSRLSHRVAPPAKAAKV